MAESRKGHFDIFHCLDDCRCMAEQKARKAIWHFFIVLMIVLEKRLKWTIVQFLAISSRVGLVRFFWGGADNGLHGSEAWAVQATEAQVTFGKNLVFLPTDATEGQTSNLRWECKFFEEMLPFLLEMGRNVKPFQISMADYDYSKELKMSSVTTFRKGRVSTHLAFVHTKIGSPLYNSLLPDGLAGWAELVFPPSQPRFCIFHPCQNPILSFGEWANPS